MVDPLITNNTRSIKKLLKELRLAGVQLWVERGKLRSKAPKGAITPALRRQIRAHKDGLISFLQRAKESALPSDIVPAPRPSKIPLSFAQQRLWFLDQLGSSSAYNMPMALNLKGPLNVAALQQTLQEIVRRHESLRTTFGMDKGVAHQVIHADMTINLPVIDLSALAPKAQKAEVERLTMAEATRPFDLSCDPMLRATLLCLSNPTSPPPQGWGGLTRQRGTEHILFLTMHHIASDGWSLGLLVREMSALYEAFNQGQSSPLPDLPIQYADFAIWQRDYLQGEVFEKQLSYWKEQLTGVPELLQLPTDRPRPAEQSGNGAVVSLKLDASLTDGLRTLSQQQGTTLYMTLLAGVQVLMARYSGQSDIVVGSPIANRNRQEIEPLIGFFINTLALRVELSGESEASRQSPSFLGLLAQVKETVQSAYDHQDIPFERLVEELQLTRTLRHQPLVQVIFALQNAPMGAFELSGLNVSPAESSLQTTRFDLEISLWEVDDSLQGYCIYNTDLFDEVTIEHMTNHFAMLLNSIVADPEKPVLQLPMLTDAEYHQIVHEFNDTGMPPHGAPWGTRSTAVDFGEPQTIQALFEQQVERTPDAIALVFEDSPLPLLGRPKANKVEGLGVRADQQLTYAELNARANQLAHHLISLGGGNPLGADTLVAVAMERSLEMVVSLLAVLKAGGAYVPIDPSYPRERIRYMLTDSAAPILLTQSHLELEHHRGHVIAVDRLEAQLPTHNPHTQTTTDDLAYVIYTSGSTGQPKGVLIEHGGAFNVAITQAKLLPGLTTGSRLLQLASLGFDAATFELLMALMHGATLVIAPPNHQRVGLPLDDLLRRQRITHAILVPSVLQTLPAADLPDLRLLITAGEACPNDLVNRWAGGRAFFNLYGPTESPIWTTYAALQPGQGVHIGQPIPNRKVYILSDSAVIVPVGVPGELYIGGEYLARGYLNRPALTAERFIEHPQFGRLYKTGDLCRWLPNGNIEFLGRTDFQVKIRGFRIELGEIESALLALEGVREAVVLAREENPGNKRLVAYFIGDADSDTLRQQLAQRLPDYMVPSAFVELEAMPLTPNGKLDRKALPEPDYADTQAIFVAPRNEVEASLAQAFVEVLPVSQIGIHDNFFHLGGDSILSIQLVSRVAQQGYTVSVKDVFQHPTIAQLATILANRRSTEQEIHASQEVQIGHAPLLPIQRWFLAANQPEMHHFNQSFLLTVKEPIDPVKLSAAIRTLLRHHDALRFQYGRDESRRDESKRDESAWQQQYLAPADRVPLEVVDLQAVSHRPAEIEATCAQAQASLNPLTGSLTRWVYFKTGGAASPLPELGEGLGVRADRLLIVIHHLAVDGVSWRILLEDLATLLSGGQLPPKTSSYRDWVETLESATENGHFDAEISHWLTCEGARGRGGEGVREPLPLDNPDALNTMGNSHHLGLTLSQTQTDDLLRTLPDLHDVTLDAVLLTALTETLTDWAGQTKLRVKFESYGRQELFETINLNRTVGWFTSAYPLTIPRFDGSAVKRIRYTLDMLRRVTDGGISFGALRYFHPDETIRSQFEALPTAPVAYNYLGQLDGLHNERFGMAAESAGLPISPTFRRETLLDSNAVVINGQLHINWTVSPQLRRETADSLLDSFKQQLDLLMAEALQNRERVAIPSEFANANLSFEQLESLLNDSTHKQTDQLLSGQQNRAVETIYMLSPMQSGMLFHSQLAPGNGTYIEHNLFHVDDPAFDASRFIQAIQTVIDHHDSLRAAFRSDQDQQVQVIYERAMLPVTVLSLRELSQRDAPQSVDEHQKQLVNLIEEDRLTDFDFSQAPLLRLTIVERRENRYDLLFTFHHILMDRWSADLFWSEVLRAYGGQPLAKVPPYESYIQHLRLKPNEESFWQDYLRGFYAPTPLPASTRSDDPELRERVVTTSASVTQTFSLEATLKLTTFARTQGLTVNTLFQAAWAVLLARYTGESDVVFGMVTSGRTAPIRGIESILGLFINTLPLRVQLDAEITGSALLDQVAQTQLELQQREHTPLIDVQRWSEVPAGTSLFDSLFLFQNTPQTTEPTANGLDLRPGWVEPGDTGYPLVALAAPGTAEGSATLILTYDTTQCDADTAQRLLTHWQQLVMGLVNHPLEPVLQLPMLTEAEYHQIVHEWNDTTVDFGEPQTIHALFEAQVERTPLAIALVFKGEQLTYAELNARANQLAHHLISLGVQADTLVAVAMERSIEMVVSLLAVLKAGGAYVPIDPTYPSKRIGYMLTDSAAPILLTQSQLSLDHDAGRVVAVDRMGAIYAQSTRNPQTQTLPEDLAYVIYTSGSTGQPKGVAIPHQNIAYHLDWLIRHLQMTNDDVILQKTPVSFDASVWEIFAPLLCGAQLVLAPVDVPRDIDQLHQSLQNAITIVQLVPTQLRLLLGQGDLTQYRALRQVVCGGEQLTGNILGKLFSQTSHLTLHNFYGPTETTIQVVCWSTQTPVDYPPIGQPVANTQVYILDENGNVQPLGVPGTLYIGGYQLARGYLNRPDLTAERFIEHPQFGRLYKTGDLCRWLKDGNIEFIGRTDFQVKIRGFRIELGEIESVLLAADDVREAVVLAREDNALRGDKRLVGYIVGDADSDTLRQHLAQRLPDYMVPSAFVELKSMPLTPNGKLDRRALPAPDYVGSARNHVPAETLDETRLLLVWQEVLGVETIGVEDNFFELGGHSLLATQLVHQMRQTLQRDISLQQLFQSPTIRGLLQGLLNDEEQTAFTSFVPLRTGGHRAGGVNGNRVPLFLIHAAIGFVFPFSTLLPHLSSEQPVYALQARGVYDDLPLFESLEALATATMQEMKTIQPHGPYAIGGWSFGGMVAFEIARQLTQQGDEVCLLGVMDTYPYDQTTSRDTLTPQEELQGFFYLLGNTIGGDYRSLPDDLFVNALEHEQPIDWLLEQMSQQGHRFALEHATIKRIWLTLKRNSQLMEAYQPQPYQGIITLFSAQESASENDTQRWQALTPHRVDTVWVNGNHVTMLDAEHVERLGRELEKRLQQTVSSEQ